MKPIWLPLLAIVFSLVGCTPDPASSTAASSPTQPTKAAPAQPALRILSGSENTSLQPLLDQFTKQTGIPVQLESKGSVDIMLSLQQPSLPYHAVWPASSIWLDISGHKALGERISIYRSPVVLGVKQSVYTRLGIKNHRATMADVKSWLESGAISLISSNPTQSNSGAMGYLGMLHYFVGKDDPFQPEDLDNPKVQAQVQAIFSKVKRTVGSSSWLKDLYLSVPAYNAMFNYESTLLELDQVLEAQGQEPLLLVYLEGATAMADSPLTALKAKIDDRSSDVKKLQDFLLTPASQTALIQLGRRTGLASVSAPIFKAEWGADTARILQPFPIPTAEAIRKALALYQTELKRPSLTIYVLDYSGSMHTNGGEDQLSAAMRLLLTPQEASPYLLLTGVQDETWIVPFDATPRALLRTSGAKEGDLLTLRDQLLRHKANGGTDFYAAMRLALEKLKPMKNLEDFQVSVILMTDGESQGSAAEFARWYNDSRLNVPIYAIMFGSADPSQLNALAKLSHGRVFDGRKNLIQALRDARSYN